MTWRRSASRTAGRDDEGGCEGGDEVVSPGRVDGPAERRDVSNFAGSFSGAGLRPVAAVGRSEGSAFTGDSAAPQPAQKAASAGLDRRQTGQVPSARVDSPAGSTGRAPASMPPGTGAGGLRATRSSAARSPAVV